ncbi:MAG: hypothetical protein FWC65_02765, partial [Treponema sp.]|nr:hypothetical protein [Treponema sp.]
IFMDALRRIVSQYLRQAEEALERALRERIDQFLSGASFIGREEMDLIFDAARGDQAAANALRGALDRKRDDLEDRLRSAAEDMAHAAAEAARQQAQQAVQGALEGIAPQAPALPPPSLPVAPSLPGFPRR